MSTSTPDEVGDNGKVGFRDIYRAVGESEVRITAAVHAAVSPLTTALADHEVRLRTIEGGSGAAYMETRATAAAALVKATAVETAMSLRAAQGEGVSKFLTYGQKVILIVVVVVNVVIAILTFVHGGAT